MYHAEYGDCVLADARDGGITVVLPAPLKFADFQSLHNDLGLKSRNLWFYVKKIDNTENEVVIVAPQSKIDGGVIAVLKNQFEGVRPFIYDESWHII